MTRNDFTERVAALRQAWNASLVCGKEDPVFQQKLEALQKEETEQLQKALPAFRKKLLNTRRLKTERRILVRSRKELAETDLTERERSFCQKIYEEELEETEIPEADNFQEEKYECTFYACLRNDKTAFVFGDNGILLLFEYDEGKWACRTQPLMNDIFLENGRMESDHSCLLLNLDGQIERLSYDRLETIEDLRKVSLV